MEPARSARSTRANAARRRAATGRIFPKNCRRAVRAAVACRTTLPATIHLEDPSMASQGDSTKGLFASLFDINFTSFITLKFLKVIYVIVMVLVFIGGIFSFFFGLLSGNVAGILFALFIVPIMVLLELIILR